MFLRKELTEGVEMPRFYGMATYDPRTRTESAYPVPINKVISWGHRAYWRLATVSESRRDAIHEDGRAQGWEESERAFGKRLDRLERKFWNLP